MSTSQEVTASRRVFLGRASIVGAAAMLGLSSPSRAEPPPETKKIRLVHVPAICLAPQYLAEELLHLEGFSDVEYVEIAATTAYTALADGRADLTQSAAPDVVAGLDSSVDVVALAGVHAGCYELFVQPKISAIRELKGKRAVVTGVHSTEHVFLSSILAYVGIDPRKDVDWVIAATSAESMQLFIDGKADAFLGFAPQPQELRAKHVGRVILNTAQDRPWAQYFCCMLSARKSFVTQNPIATKRALRAILKAADICAQDPERVARYLVKKGFEPRYEIGLQVLTSLPYRRWREAEPEDTLRFHALRLNEVGMIKSSPQKLIAQGTDWRFLNELKRELKA
ncbi:MAG TPA: ABC transporter substrate-binding protein [Burkholderiales bacterium]|nr:ABC transporter substrate-binding protein [Burkholderiales bacterium]